jgi:putative membrane protein
MMGAFLYLSVTGAAGLVWANGPSREQSGQQAGESQEHQGHRMGEMQEHQKQGASRAAGKLSDEQIAQVLVTANTIDVNGGKMAQSRAKDAEVKAFARRMVQEHSSVNQKANELMKRLSMSPKPSAAATKMQAKAKATNARMKNLQGNEFDRAYIRNEIQFHENVLSAIDQTLDPNAKNQELKDLIGQVRPEVQAHLDEARRIEGRLGGTSSTG